MRYIMTFSYDGKYFLGYQKQINQRTVQGTLEEVLSKINNSQVSISASGRTDSKVHAINQKAHFDLNKKIELTKLKKSLNSLLPEDIYVKKIVKVKDDFHARFNVVSKEYEYRINVKEYNPFERNYAYQYNNNLDINLMREAIKYFKGTHNFKTFTKTTNEEKDYVRTIFEASIKKQKNLLIITFKGNGFLRYMVRNIVGTLIKVGEGKISPESIEELIKKENRNFAFKTANPEGLYLKNVYYK